MSRWASWSRHALSASRGHRLFGNTRMHVAVQLLSICIVTCTYTHTSKSISSQVSSSTDTCLIFWGAFTNNLRQILPCRDVFISLAWNAAHQTLYAGSTNGYLQAVLHSAAPSVLERNSLLLVCADISSVFAFQTRTRPHPVILSKKLTGKMQSKNTLMFAREH